MYAQKLLLAWTPQELLEGRRGNARWFRLYSGCQDSPFHLGLPSRICQSNEYFDKPRSCDVILRTNRGLL
jgi:hypothetical protein